MSLGDFCVKNIGELGKFLFGSYWFCEPICVSYNHIFNLFLQSKERVTFVMNDKMKIAK